MIPFPIVVRELSVACRRPGFYRSRSAVGAGVILLVGIVLGIFFLAARSGGGFGVPPGRALFECLKWISFLAAGFAGLFLTSDCLSEEKRAGTLGLLFLTDLRGLDILLGKLATHSLRASFAFLAGFPIVGTCFLLGGVTGTEFTRLLATLLNTALSSLATGLLVSTVSRQTARTMSITFGLLLFSLGGWHLVGHSLAEVTGWDGFLSLVRLSPTDALLNAGASSPAGFWKPMAGVALCTLVTLSTSAWLLPRTWQVAAIRDRGWSFRRRQASTGLSTPHRGLLDRNPMVWLASRNHWSGRVLLVGTVIAAMVVLLSRIRTNPAVPGTPSIDTTPALIVFLLTLFSRLWITLHVCRFWTDAHASGAMELLLTTPIRGHQILHAQFLSGVRLFILPFLCLLAVNATGDYLRIADTLEVNRQSLAAATGTFGPEEIRRMLEHMRSELLMEAAFSLLAHATTVMALLRVGAWVALRTHRIQFAVGKTLLIADIVPGIAAVAAQFAVQFALLPFLGSNSPTAVLRPFLCHLPFLVFDLLLAGYARRRSERAFQAFATGTTD